MDAVLPPFDFSDALDLTVAERLEESVLVVSARHDKINYDRFNLGSPSIPPIGATDEEIVELEEWLGIKHLPSTSSSYDDGYTSKLTMAWSYRAFPMKGYRVDAHGSPMSIPSRAHVSLLGITSAMLMAISS